VRRREIKNLGSLVVALIGLLILTYYAAADAASPLDVVINEVAWMGTGANSADEWIELHNTTDSPISVENWSIYGADTGECLNFSAADGYTTMIIPVHGYLIYANEKDNVKNSSGISIVDIWDKTIGLNNSSPGQVILYDGPNCGGNVIDTANQATGDWLAGDAPDRKTMERKDPAASGTDSSNWTTNDGITRNGQDANGDPLNGTPKARNSATNPPTADFTYSPEQPTTWDTVKFTDQSSDSDGTVVTWVWNFGDGGSSNEQNPTHRYRLPGTYPVTLEVTDNDGLNGTTVREVEVALGLGDVDGSGTVDVLDVRIVMQAALGIVALTPEQETAADVDEDGDVDRTDAEILAEYVIGL